MKEEGKVNIILDSIDGLAGDFFSKLASKIRKNKNEKNKRIKFLKANNNFLYSIFDKTKNN